MVSRMSQLIKMNPTPRLTHFLLTIAIVPLLAVFVLVVVGCETSLATVEAPRSIVETVEVPVEVTRVVEVERTIEVPVTRRVEVTRLATVVVEATRIVAVTIESGGDPRPQWELDYLNGGFSHAVWPADTVGLTRSFNSGFINDQDGSYSNRWACLSKFVAGLGWRVSHMGEPTPIGTRCEALADIVLGRVYLAQDKVIGLPVPLDEYAAIQDADTARLIEWALDWLSE